MYRLYEPAELYHRERDPHELHNLAELPEYKDVVNNFGKVTLRWMVEGSDFMPWEKDDRFPKVNLKSPREQMEEIFRKKGEVIGAQ